MHEADPAQSPVLSVSELNRIARRAVESQLPLLWVEGEVSNFVRAASGHWYFSLKDATAQVRCAMFRSRNQGVDFVPQNGDRVEVRALATVYEARGEFQLGVEAIRRAGAGRLYEAYLRLKARLDAEGLFDPARKRALPAHPRVVGVVTSPQAAALRDVLTALARRMPGIRIVLYPTPVQGVDAGPKIAAAIRSASARAECDTLIVCRGGGSLEDLWAFNDEAVARALAACSMPVVAGVGHETDFTLADFAADVRAPTPTAAAELASPERRMLLHRQDSLANRMQRAQAHTLNVRSQALDDLARRLIHPAEALRRQRAGLAQLTARLRYAWATHHSRRCDRLCALTDRVQPPRARLALHAAALERLADRRRQSFTGHALRARMQLDRLAAALAHLDPDQVLARGYSRVEHDDGRLVRDAADVTPGDTLRLRFHRGSARARVLDTGSAGSG